MQTWEYCRITSTLNEYHLVFFNSTGTKVVRIVQDKTKGDRSDVDAYHRRVAELGIEGWELVGVSNEGAIQYLYFKRPLL